jgi:hypothetical protein
MGKIVTTADFIKKVKEIHGNLYDYSKVNYVNNYTRIIVICPKHGEFLQQPSNHLNGTGCRKCIAKPKKPKLEGFARSIDFNNIKHNTYNENL